MRFAVLTCLLFSLLVVSEAQVPSALIKVKEKSGFLGMGGPRFVEVQLSNQNRELPLTSENINGGQYYYFLLRSVGGWQIDDDFLNEDLPKLSVLQMGKTYAFVSKGAVQKADTTSYLLLGFSKELRLYEQLTVQFFLGDAYNQAEFSIPKSYWPGFQLMSGFLDEAENCIGRGQYRAAIESYDKILVNPSLEIFPEFREAREKRTKAFEAQLNEFLASFDRAARDTQLSVKEKIVRVDAHIPFFLFIGDSLPNSGLKVGDADSSVVTIVRRAKDAAWAASTMRDSLQHEFDETSSQWIVKGAQSGRPLVLYELAVRAIAYAFSGLSFADTNATILNLVVPADFTPELEKYKILEDCRSFLSVCNARRRQNEPLFPAVFLSNVQRDSAALPMPYHAMLKAVGDYFHREYADAKQEIFKIFRTCYDAGINERFDRMRVLIDMKAGVPLDVQRLLNEAEQAASRNEPETAIDKYLQATMLAPDFAHADYLLGEYYMRTGDNIRALTFFQKAYQIDKQYLSAYRAAYTSYLREGNFKPMIDVLLLALQNGNNYWEINSNLGQAYMGDSDPARAIQYYEKALSLNSKSYLTYIQLGLAYQATKSFKKAREYFNKATELDPQRQEAIEFTKKLNELERGGK